MVDLIGFDRLNTTLKYLVVDATTPPKSHNLSGNTPTGKLLQAVVGSITKVYLRISSGIALKATQKLSALQSRLVT